MPGTWLFLSRDFSKESVNRPRSTDLYWGGEAGIIFLFCTLGISDGSHFLPAHFTCLRGAEHSDREPRCSQPSSPRDSKSLSNLAKVLVNSAEQPCSAAVRQH